MKITVSSEWQAGICAVGFCYGAMRPRSFLLVLKGPKSKMATNKSNPLKCAAKVEASGVAALHTPVSY